MLQTQVSISLTMLEEVIWGRILEWYLFILFKSRLCHCFNEFQNLVHNISLIIIMGNTLLANGFVFLGSGIKVYFVYFAYTNNQYVLKGVNL